MAWVVELNGYDIAGAAAKTVRFAMGHGLALTDQPYAAGGFSKWSSATQKIDIDRNGVVKSTSDAGTIEIVNLPDDISLAGPLDALADWAWQGRRAALYWVPALVWSAAQKVASGLLEQPVADVVSSKLVFAVRDPRAALDTPLQPLKLLGNNVGAAGTQGGADVKGKPAPVLYGVVSNIPGVRVNESKLIWMLADKAATVLCVRDGGAPYTASTVRGSLASLEANDPPQGCYDSYAGSEGTYVRLGTKPFRTLSFDAQEGATSADRTHAQVWKRIRLERCANVSGDIAAASVTATDTAAPNEAGFWWQEETSRRDALDQVLGSLSGYEVQDVADQWNVAQLVAPSGSPVINLTRIAPTLALAAADRPVTSLTRVRPNFQPNGAPAYRVNVQWGRNYTVMGEADFLGVADRRLRDKFIQEWRTETASSTTIWDPVANSGLFPNAPELTVPTGYQPGSDGLTCPHAAAEASRLLTLYSSLKQQYQAEFVPTPGDHMLPGQVVSLTFPSFGLSGGPLFRILQAGVAVENNIARTQIVIGFQT
jgi:hypothetical protein